MICCRTESEEALLSANMTAVLFPGGRLLIQDQSKQPPLIYLKYRTEGTYHGITATIQYISVDLYRKKNIMNTFNIAAIGYLAFTGYFVWWGLATLSTSNIFREYRSSLWYRAIFTSNKKWINNLKPEYKEGISAWVKHFRLLYC